jgi:hypothetical protein
LNPHSQADIELISPCRAAADPDIVIWKQRPLQTTQKVAWKRIFAETTAIVLSILIAFWIDAWWQERGERLALVEYLVQFENEVVANDELIDVRLNENAGDLVALQKVFLAISDPDQEALPDSFNGDLGNALWIRSPKISMTAFNDLASSGILRYLTNRRLNKVINEYKNSAENIDMQYNLLYSAYLDGIQAAINPYIVLSDLGWKEYDSHLGPDGENTGVTPDAPFSTNVAGLKSQTAWNALFGWKSL